MCHASDFTASLFPPNDYGISLHYSSPLTHSSYCFRETPSDMFCCKVRQHCVFLDAQQVRRSLSTRTRRHPIHDHSHGRANPFKTAVPVCAPIHHCWSPMMIGVALKSTRLSVRHKCCFAQMLLHVSVGRPPSCHLFVYKRRST
jgi:hypothetical protein